MNLYKVKSLNKNRIDLDLDLDLFVKKIISNSRFLDHQNLYLDLEPSSFETDDKE